MQGVINILKPPGMTSHDVVDWIRRLSGVKKVGHAGTLDPEASGVLVVLVGKATRIAQFITQEDKEYRAEAILGIETDTQDSSGRVVKSADASWVTAEDVLNVLPRFTGRLSQVPPPVSAVHYQGKRLYQLARAGCIVEASPRTVEIRYLRLLRGEWGGKNPRLLFDIACSKGTYVRTLISDIGKVLGTGACVGFLLRIRVGRFATETAYTLEEMAALQATGCLERAIIPVADALGYLPPVEVKPSAIKSVQNGGRLYPSGSTTDIGLLPAGALARLVSGRELLAVARVERSADGRAVLRPVWVNG
ncbi:MAG: tRNA pseudouridine(55) synthase TruB [Bacillota bacterium]